MRWKSGSARAGAELPFSRTGRSHSVQPGRGPFGGGHSVAALIYRRRLHVINLYQWPAETESVQQTTQQNGYTVIRWSNNGMHFLVVSDINPGELKQFVLAFQNDETTR